MGEGLGASAFGFGLFIAPAAFRAAFAALGYGGATAQALNRLRFRFGDGGWAIGPVNAGEHAGLARGGDGLAFGGTIGDLVNPVALFAEPAASERAPGDANDGAVTFFDVVGDARTIEAILDQPKAQPESEDNQEHSGVHRVCESYVCYQRHVKELLDRGLRSGRANAGCWEWCTFMR